MKRAAALAVLASLLPALPLAAQRGPDGAAWWRGGTCYEIFVRSFHDADGDGVGDLAGLIEKLDHVNDGDPATLDDLGANCIWLMPVAQSPSYHGYDVTHYYQVNRDYGTNDDFRRLVREAHRRGIRVLVDLVLNHSSAEHPFFKSALLDPASPYRDWYRWSPVVRETAEWSQPVWHDVPGRDEFYYGLFWSGMPDLDLASPAVRAEAERIARFWLEEMGVDGFRLDAVAHFFEGEGTVRHGPGTHEWLRDYASALRRIDPEVFTVGEVWDSTGALRAYYPDQLTSYFAFEVSDAILDAVRTGRGGRGGAPVERVQRDVPEGRWSPFLRNHDQSRTLTVLEGDTAAARLAATLLLTLPGLPFVYYGEEIGMTADKPDPRLRTPMHWRRAPAAGFTTGIPWEPLRPDSLTANVEAQTADPGSLLNHYRRLIHLRASDAALGRGRLVPLAASHPSAIAYLRREEERTVLVLANLGTDAVRNVSIDSGPDLLAAGGYPTAALYGGSRPAALRVADGGAIRGWVPVPVLGAREAHVIRIGGPGAAR